MRSLLNIGRYLALKDLDDSRTARASGRRPNWALTDAGDGGIQSLKLREPEKKKIPSVSNFQQTSNQIRASDVACFKYRESISLYLRDLGAIFP